MHNTLFIIVLCNIVYQSSASFDTKNITAKLDENVILRCEFPSNISLTENIIQWKKFRLNDEHTTISINGKVPKVFQNFYKTLLENQSSSLEIFHVNKYDSTIYICQTFETQTVLCQYNLVVLIKPEAPSLTINKENIEEYQTVKLTCSSMNGNPRPQYAWYRDGILLSSLNEQVTATVNGSTYTFNATHFDNYMKYECHIWNQALTIPFRIEQYLYVKYRPYVKILEDTTIFSSEQNLIRKITGIENHPQNLTCHYDANPSPTSIYWLTNGTTIVSREKVVYIPRLKSDHTGIYTCIVENSIGKANQSIYLNVQYAPRVRSIESYIRVNRSDSVILRCIVDSNPLPYKIIWMKNNTEVLYDSRLTDLHINHAETHDSGLYTCVVYNRFDNNQTRNSSHTMELIVQTRPIIETTHSKIAAVVGQSVTLMCRVIGTPKPNIIWKYDQQTLPCTEIITDTCYLHFSKMASTDFGTYQCVAENLLGREEWSYTIVYQGKPETPTDIIVSEITPYTFKIQFSPSFDGGSGFQEFIIHVTDVSNSTIFQETLPHNINEYSVKGLNESTLYKFRIRSTNAYGESPWSHEIPVLTSELIITPEDLPQLNSVAYNSKEHSFALNYLPDNSRSLRLRDEQLCLNIRQSMDAKIYHSIAECLSIAHHGVNWKKEKGYSYFKLSVCSKRQQHICGKEILYNEETKYLKNLPIIIGIVTMIGFLLLILIIFTAVAYFRSKKRTSKPDPNNACINAYDRSVKSAVCEPRLQTSYILCDDLHTPMSSFNYDYQQKCSTNSCDVVNGEQPRDDIQYGSAMRTATIHTSPHWSRTNSRSGSNPSSESSCVTQNTNVAFGNNETNLNSNAIMTSNYGFPSVMSPLQKHSSIMQSSSSSENSTPNRIKKLFYEVVV